MDSHKLVPIAGHAWRIVVRQPSVGASISHILLDVGVSEFGWEGGVTNKGSKALRTSVRQDERSVRWIDHTVVLVMVVSFRVALNMSSRLEGVAGLIV